MDGLLPRPRQRTWGVSQDHGLLRRVVPCPPGAGARVTHTRHDRAKSEGRARPGARGAAAQARHAARRASPDRSCKSNFCCVSGFWQRGWWVVLHGNVLGGGVTGSQAGRVSVGMFPMAPRPPSMRSGLRCALRPNPARLARRAAVCFSCRRWDGRIAMMRSLLAGPCVLLLFAMRGVRACWPRCGGRVLYWIWSAVGAPFRGAGRRQISLQEPVSPAVRKAGGCV